MAASKEPRDKDFQSDFEDLIDSIGKEASKFDENEHNLITAWVEKLINEKWTDEDIPIREEYAEALAKNIKENEVLQPPFSQMPPFGALEPLKTDKPKGAGGSKTPIKGDKSGGTGTPITGDKSGGAGTPIRSDKSGGTKGPSKTTQSERSSKGDIEMPERSPIISKDKMSEPLESSDKKDESRTHTSAEGSGGGKRPSYKIPKMPCPNTTDGKRTGTKPKKPKSYRPRFYESLTNEFEDAEEMAKVIANSKGQSFAEFVVSISRHTLDYGMSLRSAMKAETSNFKEYVDHVLSQRLKDLTEVLDEEQNTELQKIKKDVDKWQVELTNCKKRIKEIIPDFDLDSYKNDSKYLQKIFNIDVVGKPPDESFKQWKEESCHRLKWYTDMICKMTRCNDQITQEITNVKSQTLELEAREAIKQQSHVQFINCEVNDYQRLKLERDRLHKENADLLSQLQEFGDRSKVSLWMNKIMKSNKTLEDLKLRNEFMHVLAQNVHNGKLESPFNQQPTRAVLKFAARTLPGYEETPAQEDETMSMLRFLPAKDGGFLLPKPLPHIGAYCYIATTNKNSCIKECDYT